MTIMIFRVYNKGKQVGQRGNGIGKHARSCSFTLDTYTINPTAETSRKTTETVISFL